ncbi:MAG: ParB/RepB/Spo0J family partition protein [Planctomycetales bacterium]|nr:ParB/RepB/Spo0J family partition protein [Planctomycetales bacterium]
MSKDRRLGKGLAALLGSPLDEELVEDRAVTAVEDVPAPTIYEPPLDEPPAPSPAPVPVEEARPGDLVLELPIDEIEQNPFQPRREFNETEIASLSESLKRHEMLMPVLVRRVEGRYQLISGERRLRAAMLAGWTKIPARLRDADDRLVAELAIVENVQRKDLNPIEKALSFRRYLEQYQCTQEDLAQRLKMDRSTIANLVRLLELPDPVLAWVRQGDVSAGHARALLPLGDERAQIDFAKRIQSEGMSVRATERAVQELIEAEDGPSRNTPKRKSTRSPQLTALEQELKRALGTKVEIQQGTRNRGKIVIHFQNHGEFDRLWEYLVGDEEVGKAA